MAALKTVGDWLQGSGWVQALVHADITNAGTVNSFLRASHVSRTRRAHQVTAAALSTLQRRAYDHCLELSDERDEELELDDWCQQRAKTCTQFDYWATVLQVELTVLVYVRSLRQGSFQMYSDALTELETWFHVMDHTNYARWIRVHLRDMVTLPTAHPEVAREFETGRFTIQKAVLRHSNLPGPRAKQCCNQRRQICCRPHRQGTALRRWTMAGPEIARLMGEFQLG